MRSSLFAHETHPLAYELSLFKWEKVVFIKIPTSFFDLKGRLILENNVLTTFLYVLILMWFFCRKQFTLLHNENDPRLPNVSRID
jgi:hypothetical protein